MSSDHEASSRRCSLEGMVADSCYQGYAGWPAELSGAPRARWPAHITNQHKVAIDTAYPTPPIEWARQDDHVTYGHPEVATVALTFNAVAYHYLGSLYREHGEEVWKIRHVLGDRGRGAVVGGQASWDDAKTAFETYWEAHCEEQRALLAASAYGKDVVDDQPGDTPTVRLAFLHLGAPAQTTIPLNPDSLIPDSSTPPKR